jgi:hypothetical protein
MASHPKHDPGSRAQAQGPGFAVSHPRGERRDAQPETFVLVENAAKSLANMVRAIRSGVYRAPDAGLRSPRQK